MPPVTRWLRWDGFYNLKGMLNAQLASVDTLLGVQQRLKMIGFYDGPLLDRDNLVGLESMADIYNLDVNHGQIHDVNVNPERLLPWAVQDFRMVFPDPGDPVPTRQAPAPPVITQAMRIRLDNMCAWGIPVVDGGTVEVVREPVFMVSRQWAEDDTTIQVLSEPTPISVAIREVPATFDPFTQMAGIRLELTGFTRIQSLMVRIYRNYDAATDTRDVAADRLIYQEVLHRRDLEGLPSSQEEGMTTKMALPADLKTARTLKGHAVDTYAHLRHAPYKVRVWVSTIEHAFSAYDNLDRRTWKALVPNFERLEGGQLEYQRLQLDTTDDTVRPVNPVVAPDVLVDDQYDHGTPEGGDEALVEGWPGEGGDEPVQTGDDAEGVNRLFQACQDHDNAYDKAHRPLDFKDRIDAYQAGDIKDDFVVDTLFDDPVATYGTLYGRYKAQEDDNWLFPELHHVVEHTRKHINRIRQQICCGPISRAVRYPGEVDETPVIRGVLDDMEAELDARIAENYPYRATVWTLARFLHVWEWIVFATMIHKEMLRYGVEPLFVENRSFKLKGFGGYMVAHHRNAREPVATKHSRFEADWVTHAWGPDYRAGQLSLRRLYDSLEGMVDNRSPQPQVFHVDPDNSRSAARSCQACERLIDLMNNPEAIVVPSYQPLDLDFFIRSRQVPIYVLGMIDQPYLLADSHMYAPLQFFNHDLFHSIGDSDKERKPQLWPTLQKRIATLKDARKWYKLQRRPGRVAICAAWDQNIQALVNGRGGLTDDEETAYDIVLFALLHEPMATLNGQVNANYPPALPEAASILSKLNDPNFRPKLREKVVWHYFGEQGSGVQNRLDPMADYLRDTVIPNHFVDVDEVL